MDFKGERRTERRGDQTREIYGENDTPGQDDPRCHVFSGWAASSQPKRLNFLVNATGHESGHSTGLFPQYNMDGVLPNDAEKGSLMEFGVPREVYEKVIREFSEADAKALREGLNDD